MTPAEAVGDCIRARVIIFQIFVEVANRLGKEKYFYRHCNDSLNYVSFTIGYSLRNPFFFFKFGLSIFFNIQNSLLINYIYKILLVVYIHVLYIMNFSVEK